MGGRHAKVGGGGQVRAARARSPRIARHDPAGALAPGQMRPGRAGLLARFRRFPLPRSGFAGGGVRPGWSSIEGGNEEFPEFRDAARSSRSTRVLNSALAASSSATRLASAAFCAASTATSCPGSAISASRAASSGLVVTNHHHPGIPLVIKETTLSRQAEIPPPHARTLLDTHINKRSGKRECSRIIRSAYRYTARQRPLFVILCAFRADFGYADILRRAAIAQAVTSRSTRLRARPGPCRSWYVPPARG